jgi:hypothetical protein
MILYSFDQHFYEYDTTLKLVACPDTQFGASQGKHKGSKFLDCPLYILRLSTLLREVSLAGPRKIAGSRL